LQDRDGAIQGIQIATELSDIGRTEGDGFAIGGRDPRYSLQGQHLMERDLGFASIGQKRRQGDAGKGSHAAVCSAASPVCQIFNAQKKPAKKPVFALIVSDRD
jgi:hypothetical protein